MYQRALLLGSTLSDAGSIYAASSQAVTAGNLLRRGTLDAWVASELASLSVTFAFPATPPRGLALEWDAVALWAANAGDDDTWRIRADNTPANLTTTPAFDTGTMAVRRGTGYETFELPQLFAWSGDSEWGGSTRTERYVRIDLAISDPLLPDGYSGADYFRAGRLVIGKSWRPSYHVDRGYRFGPVPGSVSSQMVSGRERVARRATVESLTAKIGFLEEDEAFDTGAELLRRVGVVDDVVVVFDPEDEEFFYHRSILGRLGPTLPNHDDANVFSIPIRVTGS